MSLGLKDLDIFFLITFFMKLKCSINEFWIINQTFPSHFYQLLSVVSYNISICGYAIPFFLTEVTLIESCIIMEFSIFHFPPSFHHLHHLPLLPYDLHLSPSYSTSLYTYFISLSFLLQCMLWKHLNPAFHLSSHLFFNSPFLLVC